MRSPSPSVCGPSVTPRRLSICLGTRPTESIHPSEMHFVFFGAHRDGREECRKMFTFLEEIGFQYVRFEGGLFEERAEKVQSLRH